MKSKTVTKKAAAGKRARKQDAIALLKADHREVKEMHKQYEKLVEEGGGATERRDLARRICSALTIHAQIEEEIFYPAVEPILGEALLLREAEVEHDSARALIAKIEAGKPGDALFDATVIVLCEYVEHHVKEEEREMFPEVRGSKKVDLLALGERSIVHEKNRVVADPAVEGALERGISVRAGGRRLRGAITRRP